MAKRRVEQQQRLGPIVSVARVFLAYIAMHRYSGTDLLGRRTIPADSSGFRSPCSAKKKERRSGCNKSVQAWEPQSNREAALPSNDRPSAGDALRTRGSPSSTHGTIMGKHRVIPCVPPADPDALLVDVATEHRFPKTMT